MWILPVMGIRRLTIAAFLMACAPAALAQQTVEEWAEMCTACHGEAGMPTNPDVPIIWGQHTGYIYIQLKDFKSGLRKSEVMNPIATEMEKADMLAIAEYFSQKEWARTSYRSEETDVKRGESIEVAGLCTECHLGGFLGASTVPRLAGQTVTYLEKTFLAFKSRERANNPDKSTLLASYPDDDLKAMARYLAGL